MNRDKHQEIDSTFMGAMSRSSHFVKAKLKSSFFWDLFGKYTFWLCFQEANKVKVEPKQCAKCNIYCLLQ